MLNRTSRTDTEIFKKLERKRHNFYSFLKMFLLTPFYVSTHLNALLSAGHLKGVSPVPHLPECLGARGTVKGGVPYILLT